MSHLVHMARWATRLRSGRALLIVLPILGACDAERSTSPSPSAPIEAVGDEVAAAPELATASATASCSAPSSARVVKVSSASALSSALSNAKAGDFIALADGKYSGRFRIRNSGTSSNRITLCSIGGAVLDGGSTSSGYGLHLDGADYWTIIGVTITKSQKGIMVDGANGNVLQDVTVHEIGHEGIHVRMHSSNNVIRDSHIYRLGVQYTQYGEGIYFGSAESNWCKYTSCKPDASNYNEAIDNLIEDSSAEAIEAKEGTTGGVIRRNTILRSGPGRRSDGSQSAAGAIALRATKYVVESNTITGAPLNGVVVYSGRDGDNNTFRGNKVEVQSSGYGFQIDKSQTGNQVKCDNVVTAAGKGFANVSCSS